jgi:hypothetical protein
MCPELLIYLSSYSYICVLILLYIWRPHTTIYVASSYVYTPSVLILLHIYIAKQARHSLVALVAARVMLPVLERASREALGLGVSGGARKGRVVEARAVAVMELVEYLASRLGEKDVSLYHSSLLALLVQKFKY